MKRLYLVEKKGFPLLSQKKKTGIQQFPQPYIYIYIYTQVYAVSSVQK